MFVLALLAVVANVFGNVSLAAIITEGIVDSGLLGIILRTLGAILEALVDDFLDGTASALLRSVGTPARRTRGGRRPAHAHRRGRPLARGHAVDGARARPAVAWLRKVLGAELQVGEVALSLGDVLTVLVTLWLSVKARPPRPRRARGGRAAADVAAARGAGGDLDRRQLRSCC